MKSFFVIFFGLTLSSYVLASRVKKIEVKNDQIVTVNTAIGVATIIQVPDRPNSVVVGDQEGFRVEYLDQAITIKPLRSGAKSNLYIYTDWKRYNVQLVTGGESSADYVVYLENPKAKINSISWMRFSNHLNSENLKLNVNRLGKTKNGILFVEFEVSSKEKEKFSPEWIWLTQNGKTTPINNLFLSDLSVKPNQNVKGVLQILQADINVSEPLRVEMRRKRISYLTIPKASSWK